MNEENFDYVIGVDVGGTNTDTAILCKGKVIGFAKCPTSVEKTRGVVTSIQAAISSLSAENRQDILSTNNVRVAIGTTHFINAIVERNDKNLTRVTVIRLCGTATASLPPFIDFPEDLSKIMNGGCYLVNGGMEYDTREITSIDENEIRMCVKKSLLQEPPVKNFVICGVFSPCADSEHNQEIRVASIVRDECSKMNVECSCTLSHELAMLGLLERENAAILNESLKNLATVTIDAFSEALLKLKLCSSKERFYLTQNDGTLISAREAKQYPVLTFSSGPTNSMRGAAYLTGRLNAIVVDIGGTTTDVGVLINGFPRQASTQCEVGGVKTNFPMPDIQSIGLGGGSHVTSDLQTGIVHVGPKSVGYEITSKALCFGGDQCTATDIAIAAGVAPDDFCSTPQVLSDLSSELVAMAMDEMKNKLESIIDSMKTENEDCAVILVGGGSILVEQSSQLKGVATIDCPSEFFGVANAVGAALGTVGGSSDRIVHLGPIRQQLMTSDSSLSQEVADKQAREIALQRGRELAIEEVKKKGCKPDTVYIHSEEVTDVTYVMDRVRVKVKAIGSLTQGSLGTTAQPYLASTPVPSATITLGTTAGNDKTAKFKPDSDESLSDNPLWPFSSQEELETDTKAGLPHPNVDNQTGVWTLSEHDVECLATGAAILGCGGGGSPYCGQLRAIQLIRSGKAIKIINPFRMKQEDCRGLFCGVGFMGAPVILIEKPPNGRETCLALDSVRRVLSSGVCEGVEGGRVGCDGVEVVEKTYQWIGGTEFTASLATKESLDSVDMTSIPKERCISGIFSIEAGGFNSIEPLLVGALEDLPVLDIDGMGRAFPELQMFIPFINGSRHTPSSLAGNQGESIACTHIASSKDLENFFRLETVRMGISAAIAMGVMSFEEMMSKCVLLTMSRAWQLGRAVLKARATHSNLVQAIVERQHGMILLVGKVVRVQRATAGGFSTVETIVEGLNEYTGRQLRVLAKNENYIAQKMTNGTPQDVLACTPDLITIIDFDTGVAITTELIRYGLRVGVVVLPANQMLKTEQALKFVGPSAFGFDVPYQEPLPFTCV